MDNIDDYRVKSAPATIFYIPNFITEEEESFIVNKVYAVPKPKWTVLSNRRLQDYGGVPHKKGMIVEQIPNWLQAFMEKVTQPWIFYEKRPNHVLVNEYLPGQGIMPHTDGPLFYPTITTISCGSHTLLEFRENDEGRTKICDVLLEPRSLIVVQDDMYKRYLHSIGEVKNDTIVEGICNLSMCDGTYKLGESLERTRRISLTIRHVPKVCRIKLWNL